MADEYGTVISTFEGPSTKKFSFTIKKGKQVRRGQFVQLKMEDGELIGRVTDIIKTNRYFMRPESVTEYERSGSKMNDIFPVDDWEYLLAEVNPLGVYSAEGFQDARFPPSPGTVVREPEHEVLKNFFGLVDTGMHLGSVPYHNLDVKVSPTKLLQKHVAILALSGAGKSYTTSVLIEEMLERKPEDGQLAIIILDPHGEYTTFADDPLFAHKTKIFPFSDIKLSMQSLLYGIRAYFPKISFAQERELKRISSPLQQSGKTFGIRALMDAVEEDEKIKANVKDVLLSTLAEIGTYGLFGLVDYPSLDDLARQGEVSIIDLSGTTDLKKKQIVAAHIAKQLFRNRRQGKIPPFSLIVEEAHQFAPEGASREEALARGILTTIAREGRKFHAGLCLISQRPKRLSTTILSQCNTNIILKITNAYDLKHIEESCEGITHDVTRQVTNLKVGSGLLVGEAVNHPLFVKIRKRKGKDSGGGKSLEDVAKEYYEKQQQRKKDAKSFV